MTTSSDDAAAGDTTAGRTRGDPGHRAERAALWVRWSWRDLRARWLQVAAIAVIIALGTGVYTGLTSQNEWRVASYDASYEALAVHDLRVATAQDTFAPEGSLRSVIDAMEHPEWVVDAEERLAIGTQVDASDVAGETVLVPGRIVGLDLAAGDPTIDRLEVDGGRPLDAGDTGEPVVLLDTHFAHHYDLPSEGEIELGSGPVRYVGTGYSPEYFTVSSESGSILAEAGFAVMFSSLETAQSISGLEGQVNELVVRTAEGVDPQTAQAEIEAALTETLPDVAIETEWIEENRQYRRLYDDTEGDQKLFNIFAVLILAGAAFAAFNLTGRIVEAQRREIGVGMSLGLERWKIAVRPLLVGLQISLLGVMLGMVVGWYIGVLLGDLNLALVPLPVWLDDFQLGVFVRGAMLGLALTFTATAWPVWRAVRVDPIDAIHTRPGNVKGGGLAPLLHRVPLPGNSVTQFPFRNTVRAPRRTLLTVAGIAVAIAVLVAVIGMVDSFLSTIDEADAEILGDQPDRVSVNLDFFYPSGDERVTALAGVDGVAAIEPGLNLGGGLLPEGNGSEEEIETLILLRDLDSPYWQPSTVAGELPSGEADPSVVLSRKAAEDLGVGVGDSVTMRHPLRDGMGYRFVESEVPVAAIHPNPYRFIAYMDIGDAGLFGLDGITNSVTVVPEPGVTDDDLKQDLFGLPTVAAVEGMADAAQTIRDVIEDFLGFFTVLQGVVLTLAVLIAFNSTSISADERRREHATMFAFGLPPRSVMALTVVESALIGVMGTVAGVVVGRLLLAWLINVLVPDTMPDVYFDVDVSTGTYLTATLLGVVAVALAPLLTYRRLRRMDISSTLRVVE